MNHLEWLVARSACDGLHRQLLGLPGRISGVLRELGASRLKCLIGALAIPHL